MSPDCNLLDIRSVMYNWMYHISWCTMKPYSCRAVSTGLLCALMPDNNSETVFWGICRLEQRRLYSAVVSLFFEHAFITESELDMADMFKFVFRRVDYFCVCLLDKNKIGRRLIV